MMLVHPEMNVVVQTILQVLKESDNGVVRAAGSKDKDNATQPISKHYGLFAWLQSLARGAFSSSLRHSSPPPETQQLVPYIGIFPGIQVLALDKQLSRCIKSGPSRRDTNAGGPWSRLPQLEMIIQLMSAALEFKPGANDATPMPLWLNDVRRVF
ncbi:MAG: hypothetical protein J3Q66DRAFT_186370 [Benniella sp.]|nr:MAG: hypothetical protein J3Q66DRAFT_186370 [Benniella sp.]